MSFHKTLVFLVTAMFLASAPAMAATTLAGGKNTRMHGGAGKSMKKMHKGHKHKAM